MGTNSKIEWTDATWNPWQGCTKVSEACFDCYMFRDLARYGRDGSIVVRSKTTFDLPSTPTCPISRPSTKSAPRPPGGRGPSSSHGGTTDEHGWRAGRCLSGSNCDARRAGRSPQAPSSSRGRRSGATRSRPQPTAIPNRPARSTWLGYAQQRALRAAIRRELRGKDLACWCRLGEPCHADVLLELANQD
jgi:hypothetical protein